MPLPRTRSFNQARAVAVCDRCSFHWYHDELSWQHDWRGLSVQNLRILVCPRCHDPLTDQRRAIILPPDPMPIRNPRAEPFKIEES